MISSLAASTALHAAGEGPRVLVIHGGPGFDHQYLRRSFAPLHGYQFIYYDQPGCGTTPDDGQPVSLDLMARHLAEIVVRAGDGGAVGMIAHSWGALVLSAALASGYVTPQQIRNGALLNPLPLARQDYDQSYAAFVSRVPVETLLEVQRLAPLSVDGSPIMRLLWPYYAPSEPSGDFPDLSLNMPTYGAALATLGDFDFTPVASQLAPLTLIHGSDDFTAPELLQPMRNHCRACVVIPGAGHFPMQQVPDIWTDAIYQALT